MHRATGVKSSLVGNPTLASAVKLRDIALEPEDAAARDLSYFVPYRNKVLGIAAQNYFMRQ